MKKEAIGYVRSLVVDGKKIARQKKVISRYCVKNGLPGKIFEDNKNVDDSMGNSGLRQLLEFLIKSKGDVSAVIFVNSK